MGQVKLTFDELKKIIEKSSITDLRAIDNIGICNFNIFAEKVKWGEIFISLDCKKYSTMDGGLGFTNNEDSVYGLGGYIDINEKIKIAQNNGAKIIVVDNKKYYKSDSKTTFILIDDCLKLLVSIAKCCLKKSKAKVIAITGSTGKTTVATAVYDFLSVKYNVKTIHSIRNSILGIAIQIINNLFENDDFLIIEMQMDAIGQIEKFCELAPPDYSIITSINLSHYSRFENTGTILNEKMQVYEQMKKNGKLIINGDDETLVKAFEDKKDDRIYNVSMKDTNSYVFLQDIKAFGTYNFYDFSFSISGKNMGHFKLHTTGNGVLYGVAFALFFASELSYSSSEIEQGLAKIHNPLGRFQGFKGFNNSLVIMDSYNASTYSVKAGLDYLTNLKYSKKIVVLGSLLELGEKTEAQHKEIGKYIEEKTNITHLVTLGEAAMYVAEEIKRLKPSRIFSSYDYQSVLDYLLQVEIDESTAIYFKGSGAMRMEILVPYFLAKQVF